MNEYLIVLGAGIEQCIVYEKAKKLGIKTIGIDYNPNAPGLKLCDIPLITSAKHVEQVLGSLEGLNLKYCGVMTLGMEVSEIVSEIAKKYNLKAVSQLTANLTTNKCYRNIELEISGIPIPKYQIVSDYNDIVIPLPFVIKPSDSSGSRGVRRVDHVKDIPEAFDEAVKYSSDGKVLIEELLFGPEISIEGFMFKGNMYVTGFADRNYLATTPETPYFIENGSNSPSELPLNIYEESYEIFTNAAKALKIDGPTKGDLIVVNGKVIVLEVTSRLSGGGFCSRIQPNQNGTDIAEATILWACNKIIDPYKQLIYKYNNPIIHRFYLHKAGTIKSISGIDEARKMSGVIDCIKQYDFKIGDKLEELSYINRLLYVITTGKTIQDAIDLADFILSDVIRIEIE